MKRDNFFRMDAPPPHLPVDHSRRLLSRFALGVWILSAAWAAACSSSPEVNEDDSGHRDGNGGEGAGTGGRTNWGGDTGIDSGSPDDRPKYTEFVLDGLPGSVIEAAERAAEDPSLAAAFSYPEAGTVIPPNLRGVKFFWTSDQATDTFVLRFDAAGYVVTVATKRPEVALDPEQWGLFTKTLDGGAIEATLYAFSGTTPSAVGKTTRSFTLSKSGLRGAMYYWASRGTHAAWSPGEDETEPRGYFRYDFTAAEEDEASLFLGFDRGQGCVGCHSLSSRGTLFSTSFIEDRFVGVVEVASDEDPALFRNGGPGGESEETRLRGNFSAFSPDASRLFTTTSSELRAYDVSEPGTHLLGALPGDYPTGHVAVSPKDGALVLYVEDLLGTGGTRTRRGRILKTRWQEDAARFSPPEIFLEEDGHSLYYPTISPDGRWVLYNRVEVVSGDGHTSLSHPDATVWVQRLDGRGAPRELRSANLDADLSNSWPRWAPFPVDDGRGGELFYFTYSSVRPYGAQEEGRPQLWLSTFDPKAPSDEDPSTPGLWIPVQRAELNNHSAQWTEVFVPPSTIR